MSHSNDDKEGGWKGRSPSPSSKKQKINHILPITESTESLLQEVNDPILFNLLKPYLLKTIQTESSLDSNFISNIIHQRNRYYRWNDINQDTMSLIGQYFDKSMFINMIHINHQWYKKMKQYPYIWSNLFSVYEVLVNDGGLEFILNACKIKKNPMFLISNLTFTFNVHSVEKLTTYLKIFNNIKQLTLIYSNFSEVRSLSPSENELSNLHNNLVQIPKINVEFRYFTNREIPLLNIIPNLYSVSIYDCCEIAIKYTLEYISLQKLTISIDDYNYAIFNCMDLISKCPNLIEVNVIWLYVFAGGDPDKLSMMKLFQCICELKDLKTITIWQDVTSYDSTPYANDVLGITNQQILIDIILFLLQNIPKTVNTLSIRADILFPEPELNKEKLPILLNIKKLTIISTKLSNITLIKLLYLIFPNLETLKCDIKYLYDNTFCNLDKLTNLSYLDLFNWPKCLYSYDAFHIYVVNNICRDKRDINKLFKLVLNHNNNVIRI